MTTTRQLTQIELEDCEERVYESSQGPKRYRFSGRYNSGWPKHVQVNIDNTWVLCPNVNIGARIQHEDRNHPECVSGSHHWSRRFGCAVNQHSHISTFEDYGAGSNPAALTNFRP